MTRQAGPYDPHDMAALVADHSVVRRVYEEDRFSGRDNEKFGPDLNIHSRDDLAAHNAATMLDKETYAFHGQNNRDIYYNAATNTSTVINKDDPEASTCWRDDRKERGFEVLVQRENQARDALGLPDVEIKQGGYEALYGAEFKPTEEPEPEPEPQPEPDRGGPDLDPGAQPTEEEPQKEAQAEPQSEQLTGMEPAQQESSNVAQAPVYGGSLFGDMIDDAGEGLKDIVDDFGREVGGIMSGVAGGSPADGVKGEAEYFAKAVDDPEKFPPLDDEMAARIKERQAYEATNCALRGGEELSPAAQQWNMQDRVQAYMENQKSFSM
jgi:hypothetical protein